jgi:ubiquitin carboxyl-terminal hydrolase 8
MDITNYKNKGLSGLANLGNTCFINSCIQVLSHTYELSDFLNDENYKKKLRNKYDSVLLIEWDNLRKMLWNENCVVSPGKFIKTIQKVSEMKGIDIFTGYSQNDISEFLLFLIDCFHTSLSRGVKITISGKPENEKDKLALDCFEMIKNTYSKDYSEVWNLFYAVHVSEIVRVDNKKVLSVKPEPYFIINLPIPPNNKKPSLIDCFNYYVDGEIINDFKDEDTNEKVTIKKRIIFWSFPNILTIDLKRFNNKSQKNQIYLNFPLDELDLSEYVIGYKKHIYKYELYGVCNHSGSTSGGHYTCYVKNANDKWYHFNDTSVSEVGIIDSIISSKAYLLFYRKKCKNTNN